MFSSNSYAEWTKVGISADKIITYYVDFESIKEHDGYVYFWYLSDWLKPTENVFSITMYAQVDCKLYRVKILSTSFHTLPMGKGTTKTKNPSNPEWSYPPPNSKNNGAVEQVCDKVK